jgi:hypothetical protein
MYVIFSVCHQCAQELSNAVLWLVRRQVQGVIHLCETEIRNTALPDGRSLYERDDFLVFRCSKADFLVHPFALSPSPGPQDHEVGTLSNPVPDDFEAVLTTHLILLIHKRGNAKRI